MENRAWERLEPESVRSLSPMTNGTQGPSVLACRAPDDAGACPASELAARAQANEGHNAWLASLPKDDWSGVLDEGMGRAIRWVDGVGFVDDEPAK